MDGTLLDSMKYWRNVFPIYAELNGIADADVSEELIRKTENMPTNDAVKYLKQHCDSEVIRRIDKQTVFDVMRECYLHRTTLREGVPETLKTLKDKDVRMCCISATPTYLVRLALKVCGIYEYFDFILSPDEYPSGKATPDIFQGAADRFGCRLTDLVLFDDALYSLQTAHSVGIHTVAVREKYSEWHMDEIKLVADEFYNEFTEFEYK